MEERLRVLAEVEREFSAHVVHEIKTPLALMHGYAQTVLERELPEETRRWFLQVIADQSLELSAAVDRLDELRRLHRAPDAEVTDLWEALEEGVKLATASLPKLGVEGGARSGGGLLVRGSRQWLARAFEEALLGALPPRTEAGAARVRVRRGPTVTVTIGGSRSGRRGLGLYLARRVVERFGGSLSAEAGRITVRLLRVDPPRG